MVTAPHRVYIMGVISWLVTIHSLFRLNLEFTSRRRRCIPRRPPPHPPRPPSQLKTSPCLLLTASPEFLLIGMSNHFLFGQHVDSKHWIWFCIAWLCAQTVGMESEWRSLTGVVKLQQLHREYQNTYTWLRGFFNFYPWFKSCPFEGLKKKSKFR
jgi:hypothetical protein